MSTPLRDLITSLARDADARAAFAADPGAFLAEHGWSELDGQDVGTALGALADEAPIEQAARLGELAATDPFDDGLDGAITGLGAAVAVIGEAPPPDAAAHLDRDPSLGIDVGHGSGNGADDGGGGGSFQLAPDHEPGEPGEAPAADAAPGATGTDELPSDAADPDGLDDLPAAQTAADGTPEDLPRDAADPDGPDVGDGEDGADGDVLGDPLDGLGAADTHEPFIQPDAADGHVTDAAEPESDDDL